jgi:hypothetical protein
MNGVGKSGENGARPWSRWLLAWLTGVVGAVIVVSIFAILAPGLAWLGIILALLGGTLVMGGIAGADRPQDWLAVGIAEVIGWILATVILGLVIWRMAFGPDVVP